MSDIEYLQRATQALWLELPQRVAQDYCPKVHAALTELKELRENSGLTEKLYLDMESTIHAHMGHDGRSDEANDWVTDLMGEIARLMRSND
jgi:hypothetical protein